MYSQLIESYCWNMLNNKKQLDNLIQQVIVSGKKISFNDMPVTYSTLRNRQKSIIMSKIAESVEKNEEIIMVDCSQGELRIPLYLPFIIVSGGSTTHCKGIVFLDNCEGTMLTDEYQCNATKLKASLESCYIALRMFDHRIDTKLQSPQIVRPGVKIYAHMMAECINRKFSIKLDPDIFNTVMYVLSKYFVNTVMGCTAEGSTLDSYCLSGCVNPNTVILKDTISEFKEDNFKNIQTVLEALSKHPRLKSRLGKLTISGFIESYINMYDASMLLAMENYSYFVFNVLSVNSRTYINRYQMLEGIVGDDGKKLYAALVTTLC